MIKRILNSVWLLCGLFPVSLFAHPLPAGSEDCVPDGSCLGHALEHLSAAFSVMQAGDWWKVYAVVAMFIMALLFLKITWLFFIDARDSKRRWAEMEHIRAG